MGVIVRQSIKGSVYSYLAVAIGFINSALLFPLLLDPNQIGLLGVLIAMTNLIGRFGLLGFPLVTARLFPYFRDNKNNGNNGFFKLFLIFTFAGVLITTIIFFSMKGYIIENNIEKSPLLANNVYYILPLLFGMIFKIAFDSYYNVNFKASTATLIKDFLVKMIVLSGLGLLYLEFIDFDAFLNIYIIAFVSPGVLMFLYLAITGSFSLKGSFKNLKPGLNKEILQTTFYGLITSLGATAILNVDKYMVNEYLNLELTGIYTISFFFGTLIQVPGKALKKISQAIITQAYKQNDMKTVKKVYNKSSVSMFFVAAALFLFIWGNIHNILRILPDDYSQGKWVVFFIGAGFVFNMLGSVSGQLIKFSKYYRVESLIMLIIIISIFALNKILIPVFGITGAALATTFTYILLTGFRWIFVWRKLGLQPFGKYHLLVLTAITAIYFMTSFIPEMSLIPDLIVRNVVLFVLILVFTRFTKVSPEVNTLIDKALIMSGLRKK